jgi:hypothetical protein
MKIRKRFKRKLEAVKCFEIDDSPEGYALVERMVNRAYKVGGKVIRLESYKAVFIEHNNQITSGVYIYVVE